MSSQFAGRASTNAFALTVKRCSEVAEDPGRELSSMSIAIDYGAQAVQDMNDQPWTTSAYEQVRQQNGDLGRQRYNAF